MDLNSLEPMEAYVWKRMAESKKRELSLCIVIFFTLLNCGSVVSQSKNIIFVPGQTF